MASISLPRAALAAIVVGTLTGCSSYADRVAATCERLGAPLGSDEYWPCVRQQMAIDQQDRAMWGGVMASGVSSLNRPSPVVLIEQ